MMTRDELDIRARAYAEAHAESIDCEEVTSETMEAITHAIAKAFLDGYTGAEADRAADKAMDAASRRVRK